MSDTSVIPFKIVLVGESAVGKSSLALRFVKGEFNENEGNYWSCLSVCMFSSFTNLSKEVLNVNGSTIELNIWDTAGQEKFRALAPMYYRESSGAIIVFDITNRKSFTKVQTWMSELRMKSGNPDIIIVLAGNKLDLAANRVVTKNEAETFSAENKLVYFETSAKDKVNVKEIFLKIANSMPVEKALSEMNSGDKLKHKSNVFNQDLNNNSKNCNC